MPNSTNSVSRTLKIVKDKYKVNQFAIDKLSHTLNRQVLGSLDSDPIVTPLGEKYSPDTILSEFQNSFERSSVKLIPSLLEIEERELAKFSPRSLAKPWSQTKEGVKGTFNPITPSKLPKGITNDGSNRLRPLDTANAAKRMKRSTASGLRNMTDKGPVLDRYVKEPDLLKYDLSLKLASVCYTRTQEMLKTRSVWGIACAQVLSEARFFYPLLDYFKNNIPWLLAYKGPVDLDPFIVKFVLDCNARSGTMLSVDFSAFDTSVCPELSDLAFTYLSSYFQSNYKVDFDEISHNFSNVPLITPDGLLEGPHGIPSGSAFTNIIGSTVQAEIAIDTGLIAEDNFQVLGDDGIYCLNSEEEITSLISSFVNCGLEVNKDKSHISSDYVVYLQKLYHVEYINQGIKGGIYSVYRALNRLVYQEKFVDFGSFNLSGVDYYSIRTITILENCKFHPMFKELTKFIYDKDKYNLSFSEGGLSKYILMYTETEGTEGIIRNQYGDEIRGIRNFESYKLISSFAGEKGN